MYLYMCFVPPPLLILAGKKYHTLWKDTTYTKPALLILIFFFPNLFHPSSGYFCYPDWREQLCCQTRINKADPVDTFKVRHK